MRGPPPPGGPHPSMQQQLRHQFPGQPVPGQRLGHPPGVRPPSGPPGPPGPPRPPGSGPTFAGTPGQGPQGHLLVELVEEVRPLLFKKLFFYYL